MKKKQKQKKQKSKQVNLFPVTFSTWETIQLYFLTSTIGCCFKNNNERLLKIYERGKKLVDKEFDVLQLFKSKKHDHIKKKEIDIDEST